MGAVDVDVSIILVSYNTKDLTRNCLNSIYEFTKDIEFEVFVVDNNSQDGSAEMIEQEFPQVRLIKNPENKGFGAANNIAIRLSNAKYVFCLNTDTLLLDNSIKKFFDYMEKKTNVAASGGLLYDKDNNPMGCGGHFPSVKEVFWKLGLKYILKKQYKKMEPVVYSNEQELIESIDFITGADIFFRKKVLDEIGLFDEQFFMYYEETDLCKRIKNAGYDIKIISNIKIIHLESKSIKNNVWKNEQCYKSRFIFFKKHYSKHFFFIKILYSIFFITNTKYRTEEFLPKFFINMWKL